MSKKHTETIDSKLKTAWQVVSRMYNSEAALHDATISMAHFLLNVDSHEGSFASDIAPNLGMEGTSLSRIIQSLESKKLIKRVADTQDARKTRIILTEEGKHQKEFAKNTVRNFNTLVEQKIGKQKLSDCYKVLDTIMEIAEEKIKSPSQPPQRGGVVKLEKQR